MRGVAGGRFSIDSRMGKSTKNLRLGNDQKRRLERMIGLLTSLKEKCNRKMNFEQRLDILILAERNALLKASKKELAHSFFVGNCAREFGEFLLREKSFENFNSNLHVKMLEAAGYLHDIGKFGIPTSILLNPNELTKEEMSIIREHSKYSAYLIEEFLGPAYGPLIPPVLFHHERWDGDTEREPRAAYPAGLKGEEIPIGARILSVVDSFHAMTNSRQYRYQKGKFIIYSPEQALQKLVEDSGKQFDPKVVEAFCKFVREEMKR